MPSRSNGVVAELVPRHALLLEVPRASPRLPPPPPSPTWDPPNILGGAWVSGERCRRVVAILLLAFFASLIMGLHQFLVHRILQTHRVEHSHLGLVVQVEKVGDSRSFVCPLLVAKICDDAEDLVSKIHRRSILASRSR
jgi:hypothetical protein